MLVVGSSPDGVALTTAELYDPESDTWAPAAEMAARRYVNATVLLADGRVLVAGELEGPYSLDYTVELYDPARTSGRRGQPVNIPLTHGLVARLDDGRVLMAGGELGSVYYRSPSCTSMFLGRARAQGCARLAYACRAQAEKGGAGGSGGDASGSGGSGDATSGAGGQRAILQAVLAAAAVMPAAAAAMLQAVPAAAAVA